MLTPSTTRLYWYISTGRGPMVRVQMPSSPLVKGILPLTPMTVVMAPERATDSAFGALSRNMTVWSSFTCGEFRFALKGINPSVSF